MAITKAVQAVLTFAVFVAVCGLPRMASAQTRTLRIVTYNIEADIDGFTTPRPGLISPPANTNDYASGGVVQGIGEEKVGNDPAQPLDILALEETTSNPATVAPIVNALNVFYNSPGMYTNSTYQAKQSGSASSGNGPNAMVYNTTTVQLLASTPVDPPNGLGSTSGELREVVRYEFAPAGEIPTSTNEFYIYVSHYKSSASGTAAANQAKRAGEAGVIHTNAMSLPAGSRMIFVGDFNTGDTSEPMFAFLSAPGPGQAIDPFNPSCATNILWDGNAPYLTESSTSTHYRDDYQMMTTNIFYGTPDGLKLVPGTYHAFGNNGSIGVGGSATNPANKALTNLVAGATITAAQLYSYLTTAADHFPVVADYTIPVSSVVAAAPVAGFTASATNGVAPLTVTFTNSSANATSYVWTLGNGTGSTQTNATTTYTNVGTYSVTLTAIGAGGTNFVSRVNYIVVANPAPVAFYGSFAAPDGSFTFSASNSDGTPITSAEASALTVYATTNITLDFSNWSVLPDAASLSNGVLQISDTNTASYPQRFYRAVEAQ